MNEHNIRPGEMVGACLLLGGVLVVAFPTHAMNILQIILVTFAAGAGLYALAARVPPTGWMSPFKWMSPFGKPRPLRRKDSRPPDLDFIRSKLAGWRHPGPMVPPMPPEVIALLKPLVRAVLRQRPAPLTDAEEGPGAPSRLARGILATEPPRGLDWVRVLPPRQGEVAEVVHAVLDDLESLEAGGANLIADPSSSRNSSPG